MRMPEPDANILGRRGDIVRALQAIVPGEGVIAADAALAPYESDGLTAYRQRPLAVVLQETAWQVSRVLAFCKREGLKVVPRGAGTSLSGGALPLADGIVLGMGKFNRILEVDLPNRCVVAGPGVTNLSVTRRWSATASTTRPIRRARSPAPSAATWRRIPAACIA